MFLVLLFNRVFDIVVERKEIMSPNGMDKVGLIILILIVNNVIFVTSNVVR